MIEALADGAVMMGLPRALATEQVSNKQTHKKDNQASEFSNKQTDTEIHNRENNDIDDANRQGCNHTCT